MTLIKTKQTIDSLVHTMSDAELLAFILYDRTSHGTTKVTKGTGQISCDHILRFVGGLEGLSQVGLSTLAGVDGLDKDKAYAIMAALELGKRVTNAMVNKPRILRGPQDIFELLFPQLHTTKDGSVFVIALNAQGEMLACENVPKVTMRAREKTSVPNSAIIMRTLLAANAVSGVVAVYRSSDTDPREEDKKMADSLMMAGDAVQIPVVDYIVVSKLGYSSVVDGMCLFVPD